MQSEFNSAKTQKIQPKPLFAVKNPRIHGLDVLRGLCVVLMILDHFSYDFMVLPGLIGINTYAYYATAPAWMSKLTVWVRNNWWSTTLRMSIRIPVICIFLTLSGISTSFSKNNGIRGIKLALASAILSIVTIEGDKLFDMGISIYFGILHCLTVCIIITALLYYFLKEKAKYACLGLGLLFFVWGLSFNFLMLPGLGGNISARNVSFGDYLSLMIGFANTGADWFGIMPWGGVFLIGVYGGAELYRFRTPYAPLFGHAAFIPLRFVGKKAVWFYLLHQPVILGIVMLICMGAGLV